jgi:hypothetical protein
VKGHTSENARYRNLVAKGHKEGGLEQHVWSGRTPRSVASLLISQMLLLEAYAIYEDLLRV